MHKTNPIHFKVLTLNTWLLRTPLGVDLARHVDLRALQIPNRVAAIGADIVLLQEVWHPTLRSLLKKCFFQLGYPHTTVQPTDSSMIDRRSFIKKLTLSIPKGLRNISHEIMKGGMTIFSKFELKDRLDKLVFKKHTRPDEVFVEKGAIKTQVRLPHIGWADLYNAHTGAVTFDRKTKNYHPAEIESRKKQTEELSTWIQKTRNSDFVLLGADLNAHHHEYENGTYKNRISEEFALMTSAPPYGAGLTDSFTAQHGRSIQPGFTDEHRNHYKNSGHFSGSPDAVLDYVFTVPQKNLKMLSSKVVFDDHCISDHYGVVSTFCID